MGEVIALREAPLPRRKFIRSHARECLTEAAAAVRDPVAVLVVAIGRDGRSDIRLTLEEGAITETDLYGRAAIVIDRAQHAVLEEIEETAEG
jgi:hypothetical protein